tara:strand:+ start:14807 stop:15394 length:588 start_codon:yes stop_codon:yes gene_type:complete
MKYTILSLILFLFMVSCGSDSSANVKSEDQNKESQINEIKSLNNEMLKLFLETGRNTSSLSSEELIKFKTDLSVKRMELINLNLKFYNNFPADTLSAYCLADVQELYDASGAYLKAIAYGDTIAEIYPEFSNLVLVLEKNAAILDFNMSDRDTVEIRKAYERLIALPNLSQETRSTYIERISSLQVDLKAKLLNQ